MEKKEVYFDSCIWLNLFKQEGDETKGVPYWKLAQECVERIEKVGGTIFVSTIVLKELYFQLGPKFELVNKFFKQSAFVKIVKTANEDYLLARAFEQKHQTLSFYDYLHVALAKRLNVSLITRDTELMEFAKGQVEVHKPEELIR